VSLLRTRQLRWITRWQLRASVASRSPSIPIADSHANAWIISSRARYSHASLTRCVLPAKSSNLDHGIRRWATICRTTWRPCIVPRRDMRASTTTARRDNVSGHYYCNRMPANMKSHLLDELVHVREILTNFHEETCGKGGLDRVGSLSLCCS